MYYETKKVKISTIGNDIVRVEVKDNAMLTKADFIHHFDLFYESLTDHKRYFLVVLGLNSGLRRTPVPRLLLKCNGDTQKKKAIISQSLIYRLLNKIYLISNRPDYQIKLFTNEENGLEWLKENRN